MDCDVAILAVAHDVIDKEALKKCAPYVFDCTGTMTGGGGAGTGAGAMTGAITGAATGATA